MSHFNLLLLSFEKSTHKLSTCYLFWVLWRKRVRGFGPNFGVNPTSEKRGGRGNGGSFKAISRRVATLNKFRINCFPPEGPHLKTAKLLSTMVLNTFAVLRCGLSVEKPMHRLSYFHWRCLICQIPNSFSFSFQISCIFHVPLPWDFFSSSIGWRGPKLENAHTAVIDVISIYIYQS